MPQVDHLTFISQFFWLIVFFFFFHTVVLSVILPKLDSIFRVRKNLISQLNSAIFSQSNNIHALITLHTLYMSKIEDLTTKRIKNKFSNQLINWCLTKVNPIKENLYHAIKKQYIQNVAQTLAKLYISENILKGRN